MRWKTSLLFVLLMGMGMPLSLFAAQSSRVRSLIGIKTMYVAVEDLNNATQKTGLQKEQVQDFAEQYLLKHGMKVTRGARGGPVVYIRLSSVIGGAAADAPISFYLTVQVKQFARLVHGRKATPVGFTSDEPPLLVTTWEDGAMVMLERKELNFYVQQVLSNLLGAFVQDHQEANGKSEEELNTKPNSQ